MDYTNLNQVTTLVLQRLDIDAADAPLDLGEMLELSAGIGCEDGKTYYRPYFVVAQYRRTFLDDIKRAEDVEMVDPTAAIEALLKQQAAIDKRLCLILPDGMAAEEVEIYEQPTTQLVPMHYVL